MYAIIEIGGKQYRVSEGDLIEVERLKGKEGDAVTFDQVLMIGGTENAIVGKPVVEGARVEGEIQSEGKEKKIVIVKHKRRKGYTLKKGHRQKFTVLKIKGITVPQ